MSLKAVMSRLTAERPEFSFLDSPTSLSRFFILDHLLAESIDAFERSLQQFELEPERRPELACSICEISRELLFRSWPTSEFPPEQIEKLVEMLQTGADRIEAHADTTLMRAYAANVRSRADNLQHGLRLIEASGTAR